MCGIFVKRMCSVGIMADNVFHEEDKFNSPYLKLYDHSLRYIVTSVISPSGFFFLIYIDSEDHSGSLKVSRHFWDLTSE